MQQQEVGLSTYWPSFGETYPFIGSLTINSCLNLTLSSCLFGESISALTLYLILHSKWFSVYSKEPGKLSFNLKLNGKVYYPNGIELLFEIIWYP